MKTLAFSVAAALLLAGAAAAQDAQPESSTAAAERKAAEIASQPVRDVGLEKQEIPPVLARAAIDPYSLEGLHSCQQLSAAVAELNGVLGKDYTTAADKVAASNTQRAGQIAEAGAGAVVASFIPLRGLVREVSGAAPAERKYNAALDAGFARRGYLRGIHQGRGCKTGF